LNLNFRGAGRLSLCVLPCFAILICAGVALMTLDAHRSQSPSAFTDRSGIASAYGQLPLSFEPNEGQSDAKVKFQARGVGYGLYLTENEAVLALRPGGSQKKSSVLRMSLAHADKTGGVIAQTPLPGRSNYFIGRDASKWHRGIPQFSRVRYHDVYPGTDLVYYGNQGNLEYDFEVSPGADPGQISLLFGGPSDSNDTELILTKTGALNVALASGDVQLRAPRIYQKIGDQEREIPGKFVLRNKNEVSFAIGDYDRSRTLIIDPVLSYSTYLGGSGDESCSAIEQAQLGFTGAQFTPGCPAIAVDSASRAYIAGATTSPNFPGVVAGSTTTYQTCLDTPAPNPSTCPTGLTNSDVFVVRLNASGTALDFATYLGGSGTEVTAGLVVDPNFNVHVAGTTNSPNFPTLLTSYQPAPASAGTHAFVSELASGGASLIYSTYLSGTGVDIATGIALDNLGKEYVSGTTTSPAFPTTPSALQTTPRATNQFFFSKLDPTVTGPGGLLYSTYIGGSTPSTGVAMGGGIAVDSSCNVYLTGGTDFSDMGTVNASQGTSAGGLDAWVAKLSGPTSSACGSQYSTTYLTYLGGSGDDIGYAIAVDSGFNAYVTGSTNSPNIAPPTTSGAPVAFAKCLNTPPNPAIAYPASCTGTGPNTDAFIAKFGSLTTTATSGTNVPYLYFTYLGGTSNDGGTAIAANSIGGVAVTGWTKSSDFPANTVLSGSTIQPASGGGEDAFVARIDTTTVCTPMPASGSTAAVKCPGFTTYLGGSGTDIGTSVALDSQQAAYVAGESSSANFTAVTALQPTLSGPTDTFISRLTPVPVFTLTPTAPLSTTVVGVGNAVAFTYTLVNSGDPASGVIVTDTIPASGASFNSISVSQGSCGAAVASTVTCSIGAMNSGASITITVNETPAASTTPSTTVGALSNSISVSAPGAVTQSASNTAVVHDFNVAVAPGTPSTITVPAGVPANFTFQISGVLGNFPNSISLSAGSGLPTATTTAWTTNPIPSLSGSAQTSVLTISTTARVTTTGKLLRQTEQLFAVLFPVSGMAFLGLGVIGAGARTRRILLGLAIAGFFALTFTQAGCGSKKSTTTTTGTPAGTYTITVNATSGTATRTTAVTLVVQ
jgi:hypothetical protein